MNASILRFFAATSFLVLSVAHADETPAASATSKPPPSLLQAAQAAMREIQNVLETTPQLGRNVERLATFRHTPETADLLEKAIGNPQPWRLQPLGARNGQTAYSFTIPMLRHTLSNGAILSWTESTSEISVDKSGNRIVSNGSWDRLAIERGESHMTVRGVRTQTRQHLGTGKIWLGTIQADVAHAAMTAIKPGEGVSISLDGLHFASRTEERQKTIEFAQRLVIDRAAAAGEEVRNVTLAFRFANFDKQRTIALVEQERRLRSSKSETDLADLKTMFKEFARAAGKSKSSIIIERISAEYAGHAFNLNGRIGLVGVKDSDFDDLAQLAKRIDARFEVAVPVGLIKAGALRAARRQLAAGVDPNQDPATLAQNMTDVIVGKLLGEGYARLENGMLRTTIRLSGGKLRVNGKTVPIPTLAPAKPAAPAEQAPAPQPALLRARQYTDSCQMPAFPEEVIEKGKDFQLLLSVVIDQDGRPESVNVAAPSDYPDFDRQVVAAQMTCRYLPAMRNGIAVKDTRIVVISPERIAQPVPDNE